MNRDLARFVRRLETAQALQSRSFLLASQRNNPCAKALHGRWGFAHFFAEGHFLNQALALGLGAAITARQLDRIEGLLGCGGHPVVLELSPAADPSLASLLAAKDYVIQSFQQVLARELDGPISPSWNPGVQIRSIRPGEMDLWHRVVQAGFQNQNELDSAEVTAMGFSAEAVGNHFFLATVEGQPAGAAVLGCFQRVGVVSGTSVLPQFRGLGVQRALVAARLEEARKRVCRLVCSAVLLGTSSQANLERCGFRVVYPKLELAKN